MIRRGGHYSGYVEHYREDDIPLRQYGYRITAKDLPRLYVEGRRAIHPLRDERGWGQCVSNHGSRFCVCGAYEYNWDLTITGWIRDRLAEL